MIHSLSAKGGSTEWPCWWFGPFQTADYESFPTHRKLFNTFREGNCLQQSRTCGRLFHCAFSQITTHFPSPLRARPKSQIRQNERMSVGTARWIPVLVKREQDIWRDFHQSNGERLLLVKFHIRLGMDYRAPQSAIARSPRPMLFLRARISARITGRSERHFLIETHTKFKLSKSTSFKPKLATNRWWSAYNTYIHTTWHTL